MERVIGGILGLAAFAAVVILCVIRQVPAVGCAWRATASMIAAYLVGKWVFGRFGLWVVKGAVGPVRVPHRPVPPGPPPEPR